MSHAFSVILYGDRVDRAKRRAICFDVPIHFSVSPSDEFAIVYVRSHGSKSRRSALVIQRCEPSITRATDIVQSMFGYVHFACVDSHML